MGVFADDDEAEGEGEEADFLVVGCGEEVTQGVEGGGEPVGYASLYRVGSGRLLGGGWGGGEDHGFIHLLVVFGKTGIVGIEPFCRRRSLCFEVPSFGEDEGGYSCKCYQAQGEKERDPWAFDHERAGYGPGDHARCKVGGVHLEEEGGSLGDGDDVGDEGVEHGCDYTAASSDSELVT